MGNWKQEIEVRKWEMGHSEHLITSPLHPRYITITPLFHHSDLRDLRDFHGLTDGRTNFCFKVRPSPQPEFLTDKRG